MTTVIDITRMQLDEHSAHILCVLNVKGMLECGVCRFSVVESSSRQMFAVAQGKLLSQFWGGPGVLSVTKDKCLCRPENYIIFKIVQF